LLKVATIKQKKVISKLVEKRITF